MWGTRPTEIIVPGISPKRECNSLIIVDEELIGAQADANDLGSRRRTAMCEEHCFLGRLQSNSSARLVAEIRHLKPDELDGIWRFRVSN